MRLELALVLILVVIAHAIHYLYTGVPFSTDVWPLIYDSRTIVENPHARIWSDREFDGYNNRWPGVILASSILSIITSLDLYTIYGIHLVAALTILIALLIYIYVSKLGFEKPWISIAITASIPAWTVFTSSTLKEVYCYPIALSILILPAISMRRAIYVLIPLLALASSLAHHLATAMCIAVAVNAILLSLRDYLYGDERALVYTRVYGAIAAIVLPIFVIYYLVYGGKPMRIDIGIDDVATIMIYAIAVHGILALIASRGRSLSVSMRLLILALMTVSVALCVRLDLLYGLTLPDIRSLALYIAPVTLLLIPATRYVPILSRSIAVCIAILAMYIVFAKPILVGALHRILNYIVFVFSTLLYSLDTTTRKALLYLALALCVSMTFLVQISIDLGRDEVSFYWLYKQEDLAIGSYIARTVDHDHRILGGAKLQYLLIPVTSVYSPIQALVFKRLSADEALAISRMEIAYGIPVALNLYKAPRLDTLLHECSLIYLSNDWYVVEGGCRWS